MILTLTITRDELTAQVSCRIDDVPIMEFYGFDLAAADADIESFVRADLTTKGYTLS